MGSLSTTTIIIESAPNFQATCAKIPDMEPNDLLRWIVGLLTIIAIGVIGMVMVALFKSARRRAAPLPASEEVPKLPSPPVPRPARLQPAPLPELVAEAADAPPDERLINAAASTLKTLSVEMQTAVWTAVTPRVFSADILAALRPDWASRSVDVNDRLRRLWFVNAMPEGSCVQVSVRRAMLRHMFRKAEQREEYLRRSLRAAKYFHARLVAQSEAYSDRNARFVSDTFYRFLPPNCQTPTDMIEWLYHLAVGDPLNALHALEQLGDDWLATHQNANLQNLLDALREHADDGRLTAALNGLVYYYVGRLALRANRVREALSALEHARRLAHGDPTIMPRIYQALSIALDVINPSDQPAAPDSSVWSSLARPAVNRLHWSLWADLLLPQPSADRLRRSYETLNIYRSAGNLSGAGTTMRLIGNEHLARGDYRHALEWYQNSRDMLKHATRREGARDSLLLDEALTFKALGDAQYLMGRSEEALQSYELALRAHAPLPGDNLSEADVRKAKGDVLHFLRQFAAALTEYEVALAAYRQGGAVISEGETLLAQGRLLEALGRQEEAWRSYEEALGIYRRCGSSIGMANALLVIGSSLQLRGKALSAEQRFEEALKIYRAEKNEAGEAAALKALGDARAKLGRLEEAEPCYEEALTQFKQAGLRRNVAETELAIGRLHLQRRDYEGAAQHCQLALIQFHDIEDYRGEADAQLVLGEARHLQRNSAEAVILFQAALAAYRQTRDRFGEAQADAQLGEEFLLLHDYANALTDFEAAMNLWKEIGDPIGAVEALYGRLGHTLALLDRRTEAVRAFELAADERSVLQFGWLGWRAITAGQFDDALVHFTAMANRDQTVSWQIGLALATLARGRAAEAETIMAAALERANTVELGDACRWCEYVARLAPDLNLTPEQFNLRC
jgi:tetratricopeptide (TPR) repeat protein